MNVITFYKNNNNSNILIQNLGSHRVGKTTSTIVQFSGIKKLEDRYEPDNDGDAFVGDDRLKHYKVEYGPKLV